MRRKKVTRKLNLNRETVSQLTPGALQQALGAGVTEFSCYCDSDQVICLESMGCPIPDSVAVCGPVPTVNCPPTAQTACGIC